MVGRYQWLTKYLTDRRTISECFWAIVITRLQQNKSLRIFLYKLEKYSSVPDDVCMSVSLCQIRHLTVYDFGFIYSFYEMLDMFYFCRRRGKIKNHFSRNVFGQHNKAEKKKNSFYAKDIFSQIYTVYRIGLEITDCIPCSKTSPPCQKKKQKMKRWFPEYDSQQHLILRLYFWRYGKCGEPFHCHYFQVHSDPEW